MRDPFQNARTRFPTSITSQPSKNQPKKPFPNFKIQDSTGNIFWTKRILAQDTIERKTVTMFLKYTSVMIVVMMIVAITSKND